MINYGRERKALIEIGFDPSFVWGMSDKVLEYYYCTFCLNINKGEK